MNRRLPGCPSNRDMNDDLPAGSSDRSTLRRSSNLPEGQAPSAHNRASLDMMELVQRVNIYFFTCKNYNDLISPARRGEKSFCCLKSAFPVGIGSGIVEIKVASGKKKIYAWKNIEVWSERLIGNNPRKAEHG